MYDGVRPGLGIECDVMVDESLCLGVGLENVL